MFYNKLKNKLARMRSTEPVSYWIEPKVPSIVTTFDLNFDIDPKKITENIKKFYEKNPISNKSFVEAWHSDYYLHHYTNDFDDLIKIVENRVYKSLNQQYLRKVECVESWAIIYKYGNYVDRHKHSDQQYAAVYYAKAEKNAEPLQFDNYLTIVPKTGMLVCFPGWLYHSVPKITNDEERICISFNLNCIMTLQNNK